MTSPHHESMEFSELVMEDKWDDVIKKYKEDSRYHQIAIKGRGTALHVAVSNGRIVEVKSLVEAILNADDQSSLGIKNDRGATPLHLAASRGYTDMCEYLIGKLGERKYLIKEKNDKGETPLFWAVLAGKRLVFVYLQQFYPYDINIAINNNDTSILHVAIKREMFDLAILIMYSYEGLSFMKDKDDIIPLEILATRTSAFKSGSRLSWWKQILYYCFTISRHDARTTLELHEKKVESKGNAKNEKDDYIKELPVYHVEELEKAYKTRDSLAQYFHRIQKFVFKLPILSLLDLEAIKTMKKNHIYGRQLLEEFMKKPTWSYIGGGVELEGDNIEDEIEIDDEITNFQKYVKNANARVGGDTTSIQETKENKKMEDSANNGKDTTFLAVAKSGIAEIMEELDSKVPNTSDKKGLLLVAMKNIKTEVKCDVKDTAYLIAAGHGIVEMMFELQSKIKSVIYETNSNNENALLLAVKNRQPHVILWLMKELPAGVFSDLSLQNDKNENTILHLAAYTSLQRENTWRISGSAMQMMWDIKWYKYIKGLVPEHFNDRINKEGKKPSEIFEQQHTEHLKNSNEWLKDITQSSSAVAALVASASFATSDSVPSGNQKTGEPSLDGHVAFEGLAISSLLGLYFSITSLIIFLSILSSRKEVEDYRQSLPMKLLFGLSSLFVSIVALFVSFCAGHSFMLSDIYIKRGILFYLSISICLPVTLYAAVQLQLFVDLVKVVWKKVPPPSVKGVLL